MYRIESSSDKKKLTRRKIFEWTGFYCDVPVEKACNNTQNHIPLSFIDLNYNILGKSLGASKEKRIAQ